MDSHLVTTKSLAQRVDAVDHDSGNLTRSLTAWDLTLLEGRAIIDTGWGLVLAWADALRLRQTRPDAIRPFRVPVGHVVRNPGIGSGLALMLSLPVRVRGAVWFSLDPGLRFLPGCLAVCPAGVGVMHASDER